jgi:divalent metal cation (Fe/Co/Zn/Cd) transporter
MKLLGWLKAVLSIVFAVGIGLAVTGIVNLVHPADSIGWTLGTVLTAAVLSALVAFFMTAPRKKGRVDAGAADTGGTDKKK